LRSTAFESPVIECVLKSFEILPKKLFIRTEVFFKGIFGFVPRVHFLNIISYWDELTMKKGFFSDLSHVLAAGTVFGYIY
jgi:hypothetical protein